MQYQNIIYGWFSVHHWEDGRSSVVSQTRAPLGGRGPWARPSGGQVAGGGRWRWQTAEDTRGWGAGGGRMEPRLLPAKRGRPRLRGSGRGRVDAGVDVHREKHREKLQSMVQYPKLQKYCGFGYTVVFKTEFALSYQTLFWLNTTVFFNTMVIAWKPQKYYPSKQALICLKNARIALCWDGGSTHVAPQDREIS